MARFLEQVILFHTNANNKNRFKIVFKILCLKNGL